MSQSFSPFLEKFRRITSGAGYMPEVDGLRFIAIFWVAVVMHLPNIIDVNIYDRQLITSPFISRMVLEGGNGVPFFFMISGFILGLPFLREKRYNGPAVPLKKYYLRRLSRLEPPYIAALLIAFVLLVWVARKYTAGELSGHLLASVFYVHDIVYGEHSKVLEVAWSLEVEAVFYILAPFLAFLFYIRHPWLRRGLFLVLIAAGGYKQFHDIWNPASPFINFACYFGLGMLLADLYLSKWKLPLQSRVVAWTGGLVLIALHVIFSTESLLWFYVKMAGMTLFFYIGITNPWWIKLLSIQWISIIGGMCYSIYLLHLMIMSGMTKLLARFPVENKMIGYPLYALVILCAVLIGCGIFYRLIEQPCMRKEWYKRKLKNS